MWAPTNGNSYKYAFLAQRYVMHAITNTSGPYVQYSDFTAGYLGFFSTTVIWYREYKSECKDSSKFSLS